MNTFYRRLSILTLLVMVLGLAIYISSAKAQSGGDTATPELSTPEASETPVPGATGAASTAEASAATQPVIAAMPTSQPILHAQLNGTDIEGIYGSACWPKTDGTPYCNFVDDPQPGKPAAVQTTDQITFQVEPATPPPAMLSAKLLDDVDQSGEPKQIDLQANGGVLNVSDLKNGPQRVEVDIIYNDVANAQPFVSYVYLLQVGGVATSEATTTAESSTEASATVETTTTETATVEATTTIEASGTTTPEVTLETSPELATPTVTAQETQAAETPVASETATEAVTPSEVPTEVSATPTEAATTPAAPEITSTETPAAAVATTEVTSAPSATLSPSATATTEAISTATPVPTQTVVPAASATATAASPLNTLVPTSTPFFPSGGGATATPLTSAEFTIMVEGRVYEPIVVNNCTIGANGAQTCTRRPTNAASTRILAAANSVAQLTFRGQRPLAIIVNLLSSDGLTHISQKSIPPDNITLYDLPKTPGSYLLAIEIQTAEKHTTYYYRLFIGG